MKRAKEEFEEFPEQLKQAQNFLLKVPTHYEEITELAMELVQRTHRIVDLQVLRKKDQKNTKMIISKHKSRDGALEMKLRRENAQTNEEKSRAKSRAQDTKV